MAPVEEPVLIGTPPRDRARGSTEEAAIEERPTEMPRSKASSSSGALPLTGDVVNEAVGGVLKGEQLDGTVRVAPGSVPGRAQVQRKQATAVESDRRQAIAVEKRSEDGEGENPPTNSG